MIQKKILIAPLDWGLGHASRCIPLIHYLIDKNIEVIIGADARPLALLKKEFPSLEFLTLPGYNISYPEARPMALNMLLSIPRILSGIKKEHRLLQQIIDDKKIDAVISDNRFGLWNKKIKTVFITHQLKVKAPFGQSILQKMNYRFIGRYDQCWVPDAEGNQNLSGELSHGFSPPENCSFIGPLSRFTSAPTVKPTYDIMVVLSGPEPQRSIFEKKILDQLSASTIKALVVQGLTEKNETHQVRPGLEITSHLDTVAMQKAIAASNIIVSRPGYSTVMDLAALGKKAIFVPTPGQTEQEYLGRYLSEKKIAGSHSQEKFSLADALYKAVNYTGFPIIKKESGYKQQVDLFLKTL